MAGIPDSSKTPNNPDIKKLQALCAVQWNLKDNRGASHVNRLSAIADFIGDAYVKQLGTSTEYEIGYCDPEPIGGGFFHKDIIVTGKPDFDIFRSEGYFHAYNALYELDLSVWDGLFVIDLVIDRIERECSITGQFINDRFFNVSGGEIPVVGENDVVDPPQMKRPREVDHSLARLNALAQGFVIAKTDLEIEPLGLSEKVIEIKRRIQTTSDLNHRKALERMLQNLEREVDLQKQRREINEAIGENDTPTAMQPEPDAPNKFTRKQAMALLQSLSSEFSKADNTKKADFLVLLTPYNGKANIAQEFSYLRTEDHADLVNGWKDKFRPTGRGRGKNTP